MNFAELTDREIDIQIAEQIMELVPCQGAETKCYSTDIEAAMEVRDKIASWYFSQRRKFKEALQQIISKRLELSGVMHESEIILKFTAKDICLAALTARAEW